MSQNLSIGACDTKRLEALLRGDLSDAQEGQVAVHLNHCADCRRLLEEQAAGPDGWKEAETFLRPTPLDWPESEERWAFDRRKPASRQPLAIDAVKGALGPTDDPQMLGRLGGYEILGVVGSGGMGVVLKALDKPLNRTVAIKVLAPHLATSGAARKRFVREAQAAAAVLHPNVVAIHSVSSDGPLPYLVMPYLRGPSLQKRLDEEGPLALQEVLRIGAQVAAGLAAAHAQGLVHRDITPANILLEEGVERVAITDFGLARAIDDATITKSGVIAGTPQYMSPEQARGEAVDPRSDLFSLGSVLYAMCTGRPPFRAETSYGVLRRITDDEPTPPREINPSVPEWLCRIIARLMSKRPADRFASAAEVAELFEKCLAHVQHPTTVRLPASLAPASANRRFPSTAKRTFGALAMIATLSLGLLGLFLWQSADPPDISGRWSGEGWGQVMLEKKDGETYIGTYNDTFGKDVGSIKLSWSRLERRFKGSWREGADRFGKIAVRLVDGEIRGAWTADKDARIQPGTPELADLLWKRAAKGGTDEPRPATSADPLASPTTPRTGEPAAVPDSAPHRGGTAAAGELWFSEAKEVVLSAGSMKFMLDFDTGQTMDMPATTGRPDEKLMDVLTDQVQPYHYPKELIGRGLEGVEVKASDWDASAAAVRRALTADRVGPLKQMDLGPEKHPTYFFRTRDGAWGVLQLLEIVDEPKGIRLRYKTVLPTAAQEPADKKVLIDGLLARSNTITSGRFQYHEKTVIAGRMVTDSDKESSFSGKSWALREPRGGATVNHDGRLLEFWTTPQQNGTVRRSLKIDIPNSARFEDRPPPPALAGTLWHDSTRKFIADHAQADQFAGSATVHDVETRVLEWDVSAEQTGAAFHATNDLLEDGGKLRIYVAPQLGYALPRIEHVDKFGTVQTLFESSDFVEVAANVFFPKMWTYNSGAHVTTLKIKLVEKCNEPLSDADFSLSIPAGTWVMDVRPKTTDEPGPDGKPTVNPAKYPYRQFQTGAAYPKGFPAELLKEIDRDVAAPAEVADPKPAAPTETSPQAANAAGASGHRAPQAVSQVGSDVATGETPAAEDVAASSELQLHLKSPSGASVLWDLDEADRKNGRPNAIKLLPGLPL